MKIKLLCFVAAILIFGGCAKKAVNADADYKGTWVDNGCTTFEIDASSNGHLYSTYSSQGYCYENINLSGVVKVKGNQMTIGGKSYRILLRPTSTYPTDVTLPNGSTAKSDMYMYIGSWYFCRIQQ